VVITDRYSERTKVTNLSANINQWRHFRTDVTELVGDDLADQALYGVRTYELDPSFELPTGVGIDHDIFDDWVAYGGSQRPIRAYTLPMKSWADDDLMLLDPFDWVTADGTDQQIMGLAHNVTASPPLWTVTLDVDNLLDLL
jgi:phospholipase C